MSVSLDIAESQNDMKLLRSGVKPTESKHTIRVVLLIESLSWFSN